MHINKQAELNRLKLRGSAGADLRARDDVDAVRMRYYALLEEGLSPVEAAAQAQGGEVVKGEAVHDPRESDKKPRAKKQK